MTAISDKLMPSEKPQADKEMWPFEGLSLSAATMLANAASVALVTCIVGGALATFVLVRATNVREFHWNSAKGDPLARVRVLEAEVQKARGAVADADARATQAQAQLAKVSSARAASDAQVQQPPAAARTAETRPPPVKPNGSRTLTDQQVQSLVSKMSPFQRHHVTVGASPATPESALLADQLVQALKSAGVAAVRNDSSAEIQVGAAQGVVARYVTGNERGEQFAKSLTTELAADGIAANATGGLVEDIMQALVKQGRPINDPANEWVVVAIGGKAP